LTPIDVKTPERQVATPLEVPVVVDRFAELRQPLCE
jgi:hypothetical protein